MTAPLLVVLILAAIPLVLLLDVAFVAAHRETVTSYVRRQVYERPKAVLVFVFLLGVLVGHLFLF